MEQMEDKLARIEDMLGQVKKEDRIINEEKRKEGRRQKDMRKRNQMEDKMKRERLF